MANESRSELIKQIQSEYHKKLKDLESKLAVNHKELNQIEKLINPFMDKQRIVSFT